MSELRLSIVIATRNRAIYCLKSIETILAIMDADCELIVQDNSSEPQLKETLARISDPRLKYNYDGTPLSFVENFNRAINASSGKYICVLGDDDSITEGIFPVLDWLEKEGIESVCSVKNVNYIWPNEQILKYKEGELQVPVFSGKRSKIDLPVALSNLVKSGIISYQEYFLPRTYHGIIKRSRMDEVKGITGHYFGGLTPDIYSTVALSCVVESHYVIDFPFTIAGACPASASVASMQGGHSGTLDSAPHFRNRGEYVWEQNVPGYYSVETIWADSALKALKEMGRNDLAEQFNLYRFVICSMIASSKHIPTLALNKTIGLYRHTGKNPIAYWITLFVRFGTYSLEKIFSKAGKKFKHASHKLQKDTFIYGILTLDEAVEKTTTLIKKQVAF